MSFEPRDYTLSAILGWLLYAALTVVGLCQRRTVRYFVFYALLCALLVTNVIGCQQEFHTERPM